MRSAVEICIRVGFTLTRTLLEQRQYNGVDVGVSVQLTVILTVDKRQIVNA